MKLLAFLDWLTPSLGGGGGGSGAADESIARQKADEEAKTALRQRVSAMYGNPEATAQFGQQEADLSNALTSQYTADQQKAYKEAERQQRFAAAETGNVGGSAYASGKSKLEEANQTVGTNIAQAVQRAMNDLRSGREQSRQQALAAVNAGTGEAAVQSASSGIQAAIDAAKAQQRENVVGDTFGSIGLAKVSADANARDAAKTALAQQRLASLTVKPSTTGGTLYK